MKVVHINTYDGNGGAGKACLRLSHALKKSGIDSEVYVNYKFGNDPSIKSFNEKGIARLITAFGILADRFISSRLTKPVKIPFSYPFWGMDISRTEIIREADIIHLHWVNHGFLRPVDISRLKQLNKPIIWTFHDSNAFTGGCHVRYTCDHFEQQCGNCPILKKSGQHDISYKVWMKKQNAYEGLGLALIAPSNWMAASVKRSSLLNDRHITVIPNTLDISIFKPHKKSVARDFLNLPGEKFIILGGFMPSRNDLHKGTPYLLEALNILIHKIPAEDIELVIFGNRDEKNMPDFPVKVTFLGTINSDKKLAYCYSAADTFLTPSLEDNLPNTVMESLACGTPVVAFTTGGIPDMVQHLKNGYLAEYRNSEDLSEGLKWIYHHEDKNQLSLEAADTVRKNFSETVIAGRHVQLYEQLINRSAATVFQPVLSIITVVYNNVNDIERTICSVLNQTYPHIQYIIVDGHSTDGTLEIIRKYDSRIAKLISEKDKGIYDAMNKGLALATGDYVLFMNSGDELYAPDTVEKVFSSSPGADIYYGETEMFNENWQSLGQRRHASPETFTYKSFRFGMSISHQAIYIRRTLTRPYDLNYQLSSDIDWILQAVKKAETIINTRMYVAKYLVGGMSKKRHRQSLKERFSIFSKHYGLVPNLFNHLIITGKLISYYLRHKRTND